MSGSGGGEWATEVERQQAEGEWIMSFELKNGISSSWFIEDGILELILIWLPLGGDGTEYDELNS